ncbi:hypothetical protein [Fuchsiella alkaliacetigena]|nr:hypothetical protein [Fuchsiella alkaliacetigena]MCK8825068.1 hypothetical protein [Fuchsiella alkaliacetigena]
MICVEAGSIFKDDLEEGTDQTSFSKLEIMDKSSEVVKKKFETSANDL